MIELEDVSELTDHLGCPFGPGVWHTVTQTNIDLFAEATGDKQWIHIDQERVRAELPGGRTLAHGYLTVSLLPMLSAQLWSLRRFSRRVNAGSNRVRFLTPVHAGERVRLTTTPTDMSETTGGGMRITWNNELEVEGSARPALVAETIVIIY